jgi:hypothetical protein
MLMQRLLAEECPAAMEANGHDMQRTRGKKNTVDDGVLLRVIPT